MQTYTWTPIWPQLWLDTEPQTGPDSPQIQDSPQTWAHRDTSPPPLGLSEAESHKYSTHTTLSGSQTHTFTALSRTSTAPLAAQRPCPDACPPCQPHRSPGHQLVSLDAHCLHAALTHLSHCQATLMGPPQTPALPCCLPDTPPTPGASYSWGLGFASESTPTHHAQLSWARYMDSPPEACITRWSRCSTEPLIDCSLNFLSPQE